MLLQFMQHSHENTLPIIFSNFLATSSVFLITGKPFTHTNILFWNARGIKSKKYEFINYLEANNIPIALISETRLQASMKLKCPNYITYRSDRLNQYGGGTSILICRDFKNTEILLPSETSAAKSTFTWLISEEFIVYCSIESFKSCLDHVLIHMKLST
jgi:hypothetical protein